MGTPIKMVSVQQKANNALHAVAITATLCCASKRDTGKLGKTESEEALSPTIASQAVDTMPAAPHVGTTTEAIARAAIPGPIAQPFM